MKRKELGVVFLALLGVQISKGGNRSGTVSEQFLKLPLSARAVGMGGAQVAVARGVSSIGYNPAGMLSVANYGFGASYTAWFANIQYSFVGVVKNLGAAGSLGASVSVLSTDEMTETTPSFPEGTGRTFKASDYAFSLAYARQVTDQFMVGLNGKIIQSYLYNADLGNATFAFDIGTLYDIPILRSRIGVSLTNIGVLVDILKEEGQSLVSTLQITRLNDADEQYNVGGEYVFNDVVSLRGGWKFSYDTENVTAGFGLKTNLMGVEGTLDYGYNNFRYLPGTHSFSLDLMF
jgi:hypothetical protein